MRQARLNPTNRHKVKHVKCSRIQAALFSFAGSSGLDIDQTESHIEAVGSDARLSMQSDFM